MTTKSVKFLMTYPVGPLYNEGEVASFEEAIADDLIEREIAVPFKPAKGDAKAEAAAKKAAEEAAAKQAAEEAAKAANGGGAS